jgi:anti-sigma factor RsiW
MRCPELHPEDLIDKELADRLSVPERSRLDAHVAACPVCRLERGAREEIRCEQARVPG